METTKIAENEDDCAINTKQHIDCHGNTNSNENNRVDITKRDENNNGYGIRNDKIWSSSINTTPNRSVVANSSSVNENNNDSSNENVNKNEARSIVLPFTNEDLAAR